MTKSLQMEEVFRATAMLLLFIREAIPKSTESF